MTSKLIAKRLKRVTGKLVHEHQMTFLKGDGFWMQYWWPMNWLTSELKQRDQGII